MSLQRGITKVSNQTQESKIAIVKKEQNKQNENLVKPVNDSQLKKSFTGISGITGVSETT